MIDFFHDVHKMFISMFDCCIKYYMLTHLKKELSRLDIWQHVLYLFNVSQVKNILIESLFVTLL